MRRACLTLALLLLFASSVFAQQAPDAATIAWDDPNPASANVTGYFASYRTAVSAETFVPTIWPARDFTLTGLPRGQRVFFKVYAVNVNGRSDGSNEVFKDVPAPPDTTAPSAPTSLTGTAASTSQINLSWTACTDNVAVTAHEVLHNQLPLTTVPATQTTYSHVGLQPASTHNYAVRCKDAAGNLSAESPTAVVTTLGDTTAPSMPQGLVGTVTSTSASLSWQPSSDNVGVLGYRIGRNGTVLLVTTGQTHADSGLSPNTLYAYTVGALDAAGNVSPLATVNLTTLAVAAPCTNNGKPYAITIAVSSWTKQLGIGAQGRVDFSLANPFPITRVEVLLGAQVVEEIIGVELRGVAGARFTVPRAAGTYNLFVRARDAQGCVTTTTVARPLVVQ